MAAIFLKIGKNERSVQPIWRSGGQVPVVARVRIGGWRFGSGNRADLGSFNWVEMNIAGEMEQVGFVLNCDGPVSTLK